MHKKIIILFIFTFLIMISQINAEYSVEDAFTNLSFTDPVGIFHSGDGTNRLFVIEQPGTIKVFNNDHLTMAVDHY